MQAYGVVYKITNKVNSKMYVGQTILTAKHRWGQHISRTKSNRGTTPLYRAIRKYGKDSFTVEEVYYAFDKEALDWAEYRWIEDLNTYAPRGYNLKEGGYTRGKASAALKARLSRSLTKAKSKPVWARNIETGEERYYRHVTYTKRDGFDPGQVSAVCSGSHCSTQGWQFTYTAGQYGPLPEHPPIKYTDIYATHINTGEVRHYNSTSEISEILTGYLHANFNKALSGEYQHIGGWVFSIGSPADASRLDIGGNYKASYKRVPIYGMHLHTRNIKAYDFLRAVEQDGFSSGHVSDCISGRLKQVKGWIFAKTEAELINKQKTLTRKRPVGRNRGVVGTCLTTGTVRQYTNTYGPVIDGFNQANIWLCCNNKQKVHKGWTWRYM